LARVSGFRTSQQIANFRFAYCLLPIVYCLLAIEDVAGAQKVALPVNFCKDISVNNTFYTAGKDLYNH
jgi:hypothetical protein